MERKPITGKKILVTRAAHQAGKLSDALRDIGATPVEVPVIEIQPPEDAKPLENAIRQLHTYDWLILTSGNTALKLKARANAIGVSVESNAPTRVAAIGEATASTARKLGFHVDQVPESYVAESLVEALLHQRRNRSGLEPDKRERASEDQSFVSGRGFSRAEIDLENGGPLAPEVNFAGQRILLARAAVARDIIPDALRAAGATVDVVDAYRNVMPANAPDLLRAALEQGIDAATFTSSSSVTHLADAARAANIAFPFANVAAISIGPITSQTLRENGWPPAAEASPSDIPGLVEAVRRFFMRA